MRSGRMRRALRTRSRIATSPWPSMFGGRDSRRTTCGCWSRSSAASSIVTMRSSSGMNDDSTFSVVVFPAPVPPETRMFTRPRTQASRNRDLGAHRPELDQVVRLERVGRELPDRERRAVDRERRDDGVHTGAVGQASVHVRTGLVDATTDLADDLVDRAAELGLVVELGPGPVQLAGALHVDRVPVVDHDLRDLGVADERLERAEAEHAVADLADDEQLLLGGERDSSSSSSSRRRWWTRPSSSVSDSVESYRRGPSTSTRRSWTRARTSEIRSRCCAFARRSASDMGKSPYG